MHKSLFLFGIILPAIIFAEGAEYLIITHDSFYDCILPLAQWKSQKGLITKIAKLSEIGYTVNAIKNYIQNAYDTWNPRPKYILLVGDTELLPSYFSATYSIYTDNYYAKLEGGDILADVCIGRFSVDNPDECNTMVAKTLGYEYSPYIDDKGWFERAVLIVKEDGDADDYTYYYPDAEFTYDILTQNGFTDIDTLYQRNGADSADVVNYMNKGCLFVGYRGSSSAKWRPLFHVNPDEFQNGFKLPIVISATCLTGLFSEDVAYCESWTRAGSPIQPKGAVAFLGTPVATTNAADERSSLLKKFWRVLFIDNTFILGEVFLKEKLKFWNEMHKQGEYEGWHLFGDPELNIWTDEPKPLYVSHPFSIPLGSYNLQVKVTSKSLPVKDALVSFLKGTIPVLGYTDHSGNATLAVYTSDAGIASLTVSCRNFIPYQSYISVGGECKILKPTLTPQYHIYRGYHRIGYRATKFTVNKPGYLIQLLVGMASLEDNVSKECKVFVWKDNAGSPGAPILTSRIFADAYKKGYIHWNQFNISPPIEIDGSFWVGTQESDTLFPTLVFDRTKSLPSKIKREGENLVDTTFDWFHGAVIVYGNLETEGDYRLSPFLSGTDCKLFQNHPNPFTQKTVIEFRLGAYRNTPLQLQIYDLSGRVVRTFNHLTIQPVNQIIWDGRDKKGREVNSGMYFYALVVGDYRETRKMVVLRKER